MIRIQQSAEHRVKPVFVSGASGYIGGRLVPRLLEGDYRVRCLARSPKKLEGRSWAGDAGVEIVAGDVADRDRLTEQMRGCGVSFFLIHSMMAGDEHAASLDRELARSFAEAAGRSGVERVIYLGGLAEAAGNVNQWLANRCDVETALRSGTVPVTVLRTATVIGSGSASFEILRYLVERQPVMLAPRWVRSDCQPISVRNVLHYLIAAMETPETLNRSLDIGGPEVVPYRTLIRHMAAALGLPRRLVIPISLMTPRLSSLWIHLVTPLNHRVVLPLAEGLRDGVVCRDTSADRLMPPTSSRCKGGDRRGPWQGGRGRDRNLLERCRAHRRRPRLGGRGHLRTPRGI